MINRDGRWLNIVNFPKTTGVSFIKCLDNLTESPKHLIQLKLLTKLIALACLLNTLLLLPFGSEFFGTEVYYDRGDFDNSLWHHWLIHLSVHPTFISYGFYFVAIQLLLLTLVLFGIATRFTLPLSFLATTNVWSLASVQLDGGNNLIQILYLMLLFCNVSGNPSRMKMEFLQRLSNASTNCIFRLIQLQIVFVYFCAGIYKFQGELWTNGMALYYTLQVPEYSHPWATTFILDYPLIASLGTHSVLLFQYMFPILIFVKQTRRLMIFWGILFHIGIALVMGLFMFGFYMIITYAIFLSQNECNFMGVKGLRSSSSESINNPELT